MCSFDFKLPVDPALLLPYVMGVIERHGGAVSGDLPEVAVTIPTAAGIVEGGCTVKDTALVAIVITRKPAIVTCAMVRDTLTSILTDAVAAHAHQVT